MPAWKPRHQPVAAKRVRKDVSHSLNSLKGIYRGLQRGPTIGDTRSLDYSSRLRPFRSKWNVMDIVQAGLIHASHVSSTGLQLRWSEA